MDIKDGSEDFQTLRRYVKRNLPDYYEELRQYNEQAFNVGFKRKVPVHNKLIEYGLIGYVDKLKRAGKSRILHELTWSKNTYGRNLGRFFNDRLLPALEIKDKNVCFHCLRHTVNTRLLQADVEVSKVQAIIGHTGKKSMTDRYAQEGFKLSQLHAAINKLPY